MPDVPVAGSIMLATLVWLFTDFLKNIFNGNIRPVVTQITAWLAGIGGIVLMAHSDYGNTVISGIRLDDTNGATLLLLGLLISSLAGGLVKGFRSFDNTDSNEQPPLIPPSS